MKISKLFHWLYASVMFLPLVIIPLFGIWTINHDHNEPITIDVPQNVLVQENQLNRASSYDTFEDNYYSLVRMNADVIDDAIVLTRTSASGDHSFEHVFRVTTGHKYLSRYWCYKTDSNYFSIYPRSNLGNLTSYQVPESDYGLVSFVNEATSGVTTISVRFYTYGNYATQVYVKYIDFIDLTLWFGEGNEPTAEEFQNIYPNMFFSYGIQEPTLVKGLTSLTYSDTDIGSQFLYTLYNSTDKYLNFDEVLNLGAISDWINQNVFNGNAPLVFYIVWHYLDYWLILSIFWLCFDVLIYVPNIAHRWLDKASLE